MKISVITPTFNSEDTVAKTIESILKQTHKDIEIIIVDNVSSDKTIEVIDNLFNLLAKKTQSLVKIIEKDVGAVEAMSKGIYKASGDIIATLNSDDHYYNDHVIERVVEIFHEEAVDFIHGDILFIDNIYGANVRSNLLHRGLIYGMPVNYPTFFARRRIYDEVGTFNLEYKIANDFEFLCRLHSSPNRCRYNGIYVRGEPLVTMLDGGVSRTNEIECINEEIKALKKHGFWSFTAWYVRAKRKTRVRTINIFHKMRLGSILKLQRKIRKKLRLFHKNLQSPRY